MGTNQQRRKEETKLGVHLLVVIFGITSWSILNGLWVELPILVTYLPEGWTLPSYLTIISQFGFLGLILFSLISYCVPSSVKLETPASFVIVTALTLCALMYSFFWSNTAVISGREHSISLLILTFSQSAFAATTSIAYVTFMAHLKARYMASVFIGMGLSGLIPALAAIGQGMGSISCVDSTNGTTDGVSNRTTELTKSVMNWTMTEVRYRQLAPNGEPQFSIQEFFLLLFGVGILSILSLVLLVFHPYCKSEHVDTDKEESCQLMEVFRKQENTTSKNGDGQNFNICSQISNSDDNKTLTMIKTFPDIEITYMKTPSHLDNSYRTLESHVPISGEKTQAMPHNSVSYPSSSNQENEENQNLSNFSSQNSESHFGSLSRVNFAVKVSSDFVCSENVTTDEIERSRSSQAEVPDQGKQLSKLESWYLLGLLVWINALQSSFVLAIQVYSSLPYGIRFYHAVTKAENIVDPMASFLTFWIAAKTTRIISGLTLLGTLFTGYIVMMAAMSPNPFLVYDISGGVLVVLAWVMCTMLMVFSKVSIANVMRGQGRRSLMWTGGSTQLGALLGAALAYLLINHLHLFKDEPWCR